MASRPSNGSNLRPIVTARASPRPLTAAAHGHPSRNSGGDTTPTRLPHETRRATAPPTTPGNRRRSGAEVPTLVTARSSPAELDFAHDTASRDSRRLLRDRRRDSQGLIRHADGPVLRPRALDGPSRPSSRAHSVSSMQNVYAIQSLTYAQMLSTPNSRPTSVQLSPASSFHTSGPRSLQETPHSTLSFGESFATDSNPTTSVFDEDGPNDEQLSDFETDISLAASYDDIHIEDVDLDERIVNPKKYFTELEDLETSVASNSALFLLLRKNRQAYPNDRTFRLKFTFNSHSSLSSSQQSYDDQILAYCNAQAGEGPVSRSLAHEANAGLAFWAFHILECRNIMLAVVANIGRMRRADYCGKTINCLTIDRSRPSVAALVDLDIERIQTLQEAFEAALQHALSLIDNSSSSVQGAVSLQKNRNTLNGLCSEILEHLGFHSQWSTIGLWRRTVLALDVAIVSYCGAHLERFDLSYLNEDLEFATFTPALTYDVSVSTTIMLRRRRLLCLDKFLQRFVWVLQDNDLWEHMDSLHVSTTPEQLADIWGPLWYRKSKDDTVLYEYQMGLGTIRPALRSQGGPRLLTGEVASHWQLQEINSPPPTGHFPPHNRLLIGAVNVIEQTTSQLKENFACVNKTQRVITEFKSFHCVEEVGTSADTRQIAEETYSGSVGAYGIAAGYQRTYKRRSGETLKQAICEQWIHNSTSRNPAILEHFVGVEVSYCSRNARRRRLKSLFNTKTILNWLDSCKNHSDPFPCEAAFYQAIASADSKAFRTLWNTHKEWRRDLSQLVSWCLEGLQYTGVDSEGTLRALWMPTDYQRFIIKLKQPQFQWTSFLSDSTECCSMAVVSRKCLHTDYKYASCCRAEPVGENNPASFSVLETALEINERAERPRNMEKRVGETDKRTVWSVAGLRDGDKLKLRDGRLRIVEVFSKTRVLAQWENGLSKAFNNAKASLFRTVSRDKDVFYHSEVRDDSHMLTKAVPLFIISQGKVPVLNVVEVRIDRALGS